MKYIFSCLVFGMLFLLSNSLVSQIKKTDTTLTIGKTGYRIDCNNKDTLMNELDVRPIGFEHDAHESRLFIRGRIIRSEIDDLNNDGFPDLLIYTVIGTKNWYGNAYAILSLSNKSFAPVGLPDAQLDAKIREGYRGRDEFFLLEGKLMRKFPIYKPEDTDMPTGGRRVIQYELTGSEDTGFKFKVQQSYDSK